MSEKAYFLSDVHLKLHCDENEKHRRNALFQLLDKIQAERATLFIVGDWFDFYFEYGEVISRAYLDVFSRMKAMTDSGITIHYFGGNHDFWLGEFLSKDLSINIHLYPEHLKFGDRNFYLIHGDGLSASDHGYRILRSVLRNPLFIWIFRWILHPGTGHKIARYITQRSRNKYKGEREAERFEAIKRNYPMAQEKFAEGADFVVTGHIHYPHLKHFDNHIFLTIGDFIQYFSYGYFDGVNLLLKQWPVKHLPQRELP